MTPSTTPALLTHLAHVGRPPVLVTGATGVLGQYILGELAQTAAPARALCHRRSVEDGLDAVPGDLRTGRGLRYALDGVKAVIHVAQGESDGFQRIAMNHLLRGIDRYAPDTHVVFVSQVGCWESTRSAARDKCDAENLLAQWAGPHSTLRSAPGYERVYGAVRGRGVFGGTSAVRLTPVDLAYVARLCVDTALRHMPLPAPIDIYGPETHTLHEFAQLCAHLEGYRGLTGALKMPITASAVRGEVWESIPPITPESTNVRPLATPDSFTCGGEDFASWWARTQAK